MFELCLDLELIFAGKNIHTFNIELQVGQDSARPAGLATHGKHRDTRKVKD